MAFPLLLSLTAAQLIVGGPGAEATVYPLLPPAISEPATPIAPTANAKDHEGALRSAPLHAKNFWVARLDGSPQAKRVVFLIPQYHRSETMPLAWTSLGRAIADVQRNIDALVGHLHHTHGMRCIGTEGSPQDSIRRSPELRRLARWHYDIAAVRDSTVEILAGDAPPAKAHLDTIVRILRESILRHVVLYDGVGMTQARLAKTGAPVLARFGLEDSGTNQEALNLLDDLSEIEQKIAELAPARAPSGNDAMGKIWLAEYPAHEKNVLSPVETAIAQLHALRLSLESDGVADSAKAVAQFTAFARLMSNALLQPAVARQTIAHYRAVERTSAQQEETPTLSKETRRALKKLRTQRDRILQRYNKVTKDAREDFAVSRLLERMSSLETSTCALVMGVGHEQSLTQRLVRQAKKKKLGPLAVIVVTPFEFE